MTKKMGLGTKIVVGMVVGLVVGLILDFMAPDNKETVAGVVGVCQAVGDLFMRLLRMGVVPLIFFNIVSGIAQMKDASSFGKVGGKLLCYYLFTMSVAAVWGILMGFIFEPGVGVTVPADAAAPKAAGASPTFASTLLDFIPVNGLEAMSTGKLVQVIVFAIFLGVAILNLPREEQERVSGWFSTLAKMMLRLIMVVMGFAPYGIAALTIVTVAKFGTSVFGALGKFTLATYVAVILQLCLVYFVALYIAVRVRPGEFLKKTMPIWTTALTTCSSQASLPVEMEVAENKLGLPPKLVGFGLPLGATMNSDGNAIWMGLLAVFTCQIYGLPMDFFELAKVVFLGVILVMGSPGIPGGIFIASTIFLSALGYPLEVIALLMGVFRIMDYGLTTMNVLGDVVGVFVIGGSEKMFDRKTSPYWDAAPVENGEIKAGQAQPS